MLIKSNVFKHISFAEFINRSAISKKTDKFGKQQYYAIGDQIFNLNGTVVVTLITRDHTRTYSETNLLIEFYSDYLTDLADVFTFESVLSDYSTYIGEDIKVEYIAFQFPLFNLED